AARPPVLLIGGEEPPSATGRGAGALAAGLLGLLAHTEQRGSQQGALAALLLLGDDPAIPGRAQDLLADVLGGGESGGDGSPGDPAGAAPRARVIRARRPSGGGASPGDAAERADGTRPGGERTGSASTGGPGADGVRTEGRRAPLPGPLADVDEGAATGEWDTLRGVVSAATGLEELNRLREQGGWLAVASRPVPPELLPTAEREAELLLRRATAAGRPVVGEDSGLGVGAAVDPDRAAAWARRTLAPLLDAPETRDGPESGEGPESGDGPAPGLTEVLRVWLGCHGGWDRTARVTGLHRNSVRHRVRRAERLLGADLSDAAVRAELLLALAWCRETAG
ncbi:PucR family transcriptional regulator, partial [Streptomyces fuscigenes]|uniref:PucR family transcriptional regulator n=1 Tax=Streptomyces fuscigenes TaxID=1528880 RepID=UPI001F27C401